MEAPISPFASAYLNAVRIVAALAVVLYHLKDKGFVTGPLARFLPANGTAYVIVFFVVSGLSISMMAERRTSLSDFCIDRFSRIYVVALPTIILCTALAFVAPHISPDRFYWSNTLLSALFLNQSWNENGWPFSDGPYWSLAYEIWYYAIFGVLFYLTGLSKAVAIPLALIAGPKILILFPCWAIGWACYKARNIELKNWFALICFIIIPALIVASLAAGLRNIANSLSLGFNGTESSGFVRSWIVAAAFAINLWGALHLNISMPRWAKNIADLGAGMSFSLYLLHLPLLYVFGFVLGRGNVKIIAAVPLIVAICYLFSLATERQTARVRRYLIGILDRVRGTRRAEQVAVGVARIAGHRPNGPAV